MREHSQHPEREAHSLVSAKLHPFLPLLTTDGQKALFYVSEQYARYLCTTQSKDVRDALMKDRDEARSLSVKLHSLASTLTKAGNDLELIAGRLVTALQPKLYDLIPALDAESTENSNAIALHRENLRTAAAFCSEAIAKLKPSVSRKRSRALSPPELKSADLFYQPDVVAAAVFYIFRKYSKEPLNVSRSEAVSAQVLSALDDGGRLPDSVRIAISRFRRDSRFLAHRAALRDWFDTEYFRP